MRIGIIGAGKIGGTLARRLASLGHDVSLTNSHGPESLKALAAEIGVKPVSVKQAARSGEIVIVTIPERAVQDLPRDLFEGVPDDVVVIDTGNYYPSRDGKISAIESGEAESTWVASHLGRAVVKAFNNIFFKHLLERGTPKGTPGRIALPVAGDPPDARQKVMQLVDELGFDPVDAGSLDESWRQQPGTPAYTQDMDAPHLKQALAAAEHSRVPEYRRSANEAAKAFLQPPRG
jgi:predicted dinucleotide-binding enzyme